MSDNRDFSINFLNLYSKRKCQLFLFIASQGRFWQSGNAYGNGKLTEHFKEEPNLCFFFFYIAEPFFFAEFY